LVVSKGKGVIHYNNGDLDIVLWDVVKVLSLYFKSANQVPIWWLTSDIAYYQTPTSVKYSALIAMGTFVADYERDISYFLSLFIPHGQEVNITFA
jgi:predicted nucleotidyltransferase